MRARHVVGAAVGAVIALSGCSDPAPAGQVTMNVPTAQPTLPPACKDLFRPGKVVDKAAAAGGCTNLAGGVEFVGAFDCTDGTKMWQVDGGETGAPNGYAREGKPYIVIKGESAANAGYKKAYESCNGG